MKKINKKSLIRAIVQIICFVLLPGLFISIYTGIKNIFTTITHNTGNLSALLPDILLVASVVPLTIILGRFFCGWMCSLGSIQDLLFMGFKNIKKKPIKVSEKVDFCLKSIKYIILGVSIIFIWTLQIVAVPKGYNPWDVFGMLISFGKFENLGLVVTDFLLGTILLFVLITASLFIERFFCRYLCPLGALFAIVSRLRIFKINKEKSKCGACRLCTRECSMGIPLYKSDIVHSGECINCFKCVDICPRQNINSKLTKLEVNSEVAGTVAAATMVGFFYLGNLTSTSIEAQNITTQNIQQEIANSNSSDVKGKYTDGTYEGSGQGFRGTTTVEVKVSNSKITEVKLMSSNDDDEFLDRAVNGVVSEMLTSQLVDVDAVSGATYSSNGIKEAVANALNVPFEKQAITEKGRGHGHRR